MATLKHLSSKSADYGRPIRYLMFEHDRNGVPLRDAEGNLIMREEFYIDGINCTPLSFDKECEMLNWKYHKNQNYNDIKSHHYILSFDPKDKEDGLLDTARAHELGKEFARRCFPGHQILVCTHSNGHNGSGNIHVHLILNSLRKYDVEKQPFMERDIDSRAGYKHNLTPRYLKYLQSQVMQICEREGLHQVDLLTPARAKVTDTEYKAKESGQIALDDRNERIRAAQMIPRNTVFRTQKQFLRDAILDAADHASSIEEFKEILLKKYRIELKDHRGRFSYLHPDRKKYITGRALGTDYEKENLLARIHSHSVEDEADNKNTPRQNLDNKESSPACENELPVNEASSEKKHDASHMTGDEMAAAYCSGRTDLSTDYNPAYDYHADPVAIIFVRTKLRLVVDLQTNVKAQMSTAYARKVKISNLKEMARTVVFIQELGIDSREELIQRQKEISERVKNADNAVKSIDNEIKSINQQIHFAGQYYASRSVHAEFLRSWNKGRFRSKHRDELDRYEEAVKFFKEKSEGNIPQLKALKEQKDFLQTRKQNQIAALDTLRQSQKNIDTAVSNIEAILGSENPKSKDVHHSKQTARNDEPSL